MKSGLRCLAIALGALALLAPATHAVADGEHGHAARPQLIPRAGHGAAVVKALGDRLPAAAATNRMSASRLASILESAATAGVGRDGQLFYKEAAAALAAAGAEVTAAAAYPESSTFALHSLPGSAH